MSSPQNKTEVIASWSIFFIGALLLFIALFTDPIGTSPDTGIIDLGTVGTRWLLGGIGSVCLLVGIVALIMNRSTN
jgi:nitrate reductase gamma subunit